MKDCGHTMKRDEGSSFCHSCYMIKWRKKNPEKARANSRKAYYKRKARDPEGLRRAQANNKLQSSYGISLEEREAMERKQDGKCALCEKDRKLVVDHCHDTGKIRGLICRPCNVALGTLGDSKEALQKVLEYLS